METDSRDVQVNARFKPDTLLCLLLFVAARGVLETSLCSSFECGKLPGNFLFESCDLSGHPHPGLWGLSPGSGPFSARTETATGWRGHLVVSGASVELLRSAKRNVDNGTSSYPRESEGKTGLMISETCSFSTLFLKCQTMEPAIHHESEIHQWMDSVCYNDSPLHFWILFENNFYCAMLEKANK